LIKKTGLGSKQEKRGLKNANGKRKSPDFFYFLYNTFSFLQKKKTSANLSFKKKALPKKRGLALRAGNQKEKNQRFLFEDDKMSSVEK